jgi:hypothetical protein
MNIRFTIALIAVLALAGCGSSTSPASPKADAPAQVACEHFHNVMGDFNNGLLTTAEMRDKIKQVYDTASVSEDAGIPDGAQSMLAATTADDGAAFLTASAAFTAACKAVGL